MNSDFLEKIIDSVNEGIIAIDREGIIKCYNRKAKEIFGIIYNQGIGHGAGRLEAGDIVVIADSCLGEDDGGLTGSDLFSIGIENAVIPRGSAIAAIGTMGSSASGHLRVLSGTEKDSRLVEKQIMNGHEIDVEIDFAMQTASITIDGQAFPYTFIKSIGHMVVLNGASGKVKFYQSAGYTARREDIKSILRGKPFRAKGEGAVEMDVVGCSIFDVHPRESNINIIEFFDAAKGSNISYSKELREINGRPTRCSLVPIKDEDLVIGAIMRVEDITELKSVIDERDYALRTLDAMENKLRDAESVAFSEITGQSESIRTVRQLAKKASESDSTVLLLGESGTGKGLIAECIHKYSKRKNGPFVYVNCASIPESLLESELFGYEGGSFTGAKKEGKTGLFEAANGGTIFLDEIGDMPVFFQVKLLHVLQNKCLRKVGSTRDIQLDVRIITATNKDLEAAVADGSFRKDLFYRISVFPIYIPPLRLRREDIFPLIHDLLPRICDRVGCSERRISGEAIRLMTNYSWPGNVREMENVLERAVNIAEGSTLLKEHFNLMQDKSEESVSFSGETMEKILEQAEKKAIIEALKITRGSKTDAMKLLGMGKTSFYDKLKKYRI